MEHAEKKESPPSSSSTSTRNSRGSLEVFNPSTFSRPTYQVFRPQSSWNNWTDNSDPPENISGRDNNVSNKITSWMALKDPTSPPPMLPVVNEGLKSPTGVGSVAQRAAEWGLVLKTDDETGKLKGVKVRNSGGDEPNNRASSPSRKNSSTSVRSSGDLSDDGDREKGIPRVSKDLKDALSTFQQTFVVSDATKPDYPILYASAGFFKMTGYTSKEVIGRNCRFMQGAETNPEDVGKIREALQQGKSYCGRLLNYKKDGSPFWNLLTISPIKDEHGKTLKFIGMQVEVSKHTEGFKENMLRPNGLPESLIRYDARQKEMASSSVTELVQAVERPETNIRHLLRRSSDPGSDQDRLDALGNQYKAVTSAAPPPRRNSHAGVRISMQPPATAPPRRNSHAGIRTTMQSINELPEKKLKKPRRRHSFMGIIKKHQRASSEDNDDDDDGFENAVLGGDNDDEENESVENDDERPGSLDDKVKQKEKRKGLDLATTLERIEKNFVITDPRLPDNPIIFASDSFLELTEYSREEILGKNCRFLQGPETDPATVRKIRDAIDNQTEVTVQLINYTKTGKKFWNLFHLQPMRDHKGDVQYFIGVQLDGSQHVEPLHNCIPETTAKESAKQVKETAGNVDEAARELPDANSKPEDLWKNHSKKVHPKPHRKDSPAWRAISKILSDGEQLGLKHFRPIKPLGSGDTGSVHLVELCGTGEYFAMKAMDKGVMLNRNKVHRACAEREILDMLDHPFLPALYASFQTKTHVCLVTDYCSGGELFVLLDRQPTKVLKENAVRFFAAEVVVALEYLHCQGIIYRDLKPENILIQSNGHVLLTDFDLSCLTSCKPQLLIPQLTDKKKKKKNKHQKGEQDFILPKKHQKGQQDPIFMAEPMRASNSFVGTEEYIAPEIISGVGHTSAVDWWALGVLLYEMLYGYTPFRGKTRQRTFANVLQKEIKFPGSKVVSLEAKQLIYRLLHKDPKNRLGSREGANEIKQHPFFRGLNWALVRCESPPALDAPLFQLIEEELREVDSGLQELQTNIF